LILEINFKIYRQNFARLKIFITFARSLKQGLLVLVSLR